MSEKIQFREVVIPGVEEPMRFEADHAVLVVMNKTDDGRMEMEMWWHEPTGTNLILAAQIIADHLEAHPNPGMKLTGKVMNASINDGLAHLKAKVAHEKGMDEENNN